MGCPVPKVAGNGEGSALMRNPKLVEQIVSKTVRAIKKPVTVKIRKGFTASEVNAVEIARIAEASGAAAVAVHGRTREQYYTGTADWDIIRQVKEAVSIPVIGNGDVDSAGKAKQLLELVPEELKQPELTADWEMRLSQIAKGKLSRKDFMKDIDKYTDQVVSEIKAGAGTFRHDNLTNSKCPRCGKRMLAVKGKNSEMLVCQDRECGYRETVSRTTNARCPVCHKKMQLKGRGDGQIFVCVCGHKEKLTSFQERRKKEGAGVSKKDVQKYLRQQKDEPVNNPFSDALAKIKL